MIPPNRLNEKTSNIVELTPAEVIEGALAGVMRITTSRKNGNEHRYHQPKDEWSIGIQGALGEIAVAKYLGLYWSPGVNVFKGADLGDRIQVRTISDARHRLIVRKGDDPDHVFILVMGHYSTFEILGWTYGANAQRPKYWTDPGNGGEPAYFVPQSELRTMKSLEDE